MNNSKTISTFLLAILPLAFTFGAHGSYGREFFDWLGIMVGIFFLWGLIKIIENGNVREDDSAIDEEIFDHFIDNEPSKE